MDFDDPKPKPEKRKSQYIFLLPSLRATIDALRQPLKISRSEWIERAIHEKLKRDRP